MRDISRLPRFLEDFDDLLHNAGIANLHQKLRIKT